MSNNLKLIKMKKVLLIVALLVSVSYMHAQTFATLTLPNVEVTAPGEIAIPFELTYCSPGDLIVGIQFSMLYDNTKIEWMGTSAAPANGISYISPQCTPLGGDWLWNANFPGNLIFSWIDPTFNGVLFPAPQNIIVFRFQYLGGLAEGESTPLSFSLTAKMANGQNIKIINELTNQYFDVYQLTLVDGSVSVPGVPPTGKTWTGAGGDLDWFNGANWAPPGAPAATDDVTINATKAPMVVISGGVASTAALTVAAGAGITIASDGGLTTNGVFINNGDLMIQSNPLNGFAGSYIDNAGIAGSGNFMFDRYVLCSGTQAGTGSALGWHYLSAPFDGFTTDAIPEFFVNGWNQGTGMWMQYEGPIGLPCTPISPAIALNTMDAWSINLDVDYGPNCGMPFDQTANFMTGAAGVHTGPYAAALGFGGGMYQQWNLVGNPYPSGLDVNTIAFGANTVAATYFYDGCLGNYVYWATGLGSYVMAPTLGFFVETSAPDILPVGNASRAHGADWFWKSDVANLLTLKASGNDRSDVLNVRFAEDVTAGFDNNGDAHKLFAETPGLPQIYTVAGDEMLAINALPETATVPMGFKANGAGTYTIEAIETSEFQNVVLEDLFTGIETDLLAGNYTFEYNVDDNANRFVIHFTPLGTPELGANDINIWAANQTIYVQAPATTGDIVVYNMMGQVVVKTAIEPGLNEIPMNDANTYYIVKVLGSDVTETGKVFIK